MRVVESPGGTERIDPWWGRPPGRTRAPSPCGPSAPRSFPSVSAPARPRVGWWRSGDATTTAAAPDVAGPSRNWESISVTRWSRQRPYRRRSVSSSSPGNGHDSGWKARCALDDPGQGAAWTRACGAGSRPAGRRGSRSSRRKLSVPAPLRSADAMQSAPRCCAPGLDWHVHRWFSHQDAGCPAGLAAAPAGRRRRVGSATASRSTRSSRTAGDSKKLPPTRSSHGEAERSHLLLHLDGLPVLSAQDADRFRGSSACASGQPGCCLLGESFLLTRSSVTGLLPSSSRGCGLSRSASVVREEVTCSPAAEEGVQ